MNIDIYMHDDLNTHMLHPRARVSVSGCIEEIEI